MDLFFSAICIIALLIRGVKTKSDMANTRSFFFSVSGAVVLMWIILFPLTSCAHEVKHGTGVETRPVLRNFLLEEFTAIHCSYCPSGHETAQNLRHVLGERLQTIAVHVSSLAVPGGNEPDFRTSFGESWFAASGGSAIPSGNINRTFFPQLADNGQSGALNPERYSLMRSEWPSAVKYSLGDTALVNLYVEAALDTLSRRLDVRVEYFYPKEVEDSYSLLNVVLTENFIRGAQTGSSEGSRYLHRHIARDLLTDVWGDTVYDTEAGKVRERRYSLILPERYGNQAPVFPNLEVVAFMSRPNKEVLNSASSQVSYQGRYRAPEVSLSAPSLFTTHSRHSIPVRIENLGTDTLKKIRFVVVMGAQTYEPEVSLSIPYGQEHEVEVPLGDYPFSKVVKYRISATHLNGEAVESNTVADYISEPVQVRTDRVSIVLTTDTYGSEITYAVRNREGEVLQSGGPFQDGAPRTDSIGFSLLPDEIYSFEVRDAFLDGFQGGYEIKDADGGVIFSASYVGMYGAAFSFVLPKSTETGTERARQGREPGIRLSHNPVPAYRPDNQLTFDGFGSGQLDMEVFDMQGKVVFRNRIPVRAAEKTIYNLDTHQFNSGFYFIRVGVDGRAAVEKMIIQ